MLKVQKKQPFLSFPAITKIIKHMHVLKCFENNRKKTGKTDNENQLSVFSKYKKKKKKKSKLETTSDQSRESKNVGLKFLMVSLWK